MIVVLNIIFVAGLILEFLIETTAGLLNIKYLKNKLSSPDRPLKETFDDELLAKTLNYLRVNTVFSILKNSVSICCLLYLIYSGLFLELSRYSNTFTGSSVLNHLIFIMIIFIIFYLISIPFNVFKTFFIEKRFGFSTITIKTFIFDNIKILLLTTVIGGILSLTIFKTVILFKNIYWFIAWIIFTLFSLLMIKIFPAFIAPLFNKFEPVNDDTLRESLTRMAEKTGFSFKKILKNDASKRSTHSNAYFTGFGKNKQIVLFDNLLKQLNIKEITAVLCHEIGHYKKKHIWLHFISQSLITGLTLLLIYKLTCSINFLTAFKVNTPPYLTKFIFSLVFTNSFLWLINFPLTFISRKFEFSADNFAVEILEEPDSLANSLVALTKENLSNPYPHPLYSTLFYSHPPLIERISNIRHKKKST